MKTAVLVVNLGTPDAPTAGAIRRYLREFLSDRRVVSLSRLVWWPVLYGFILPFRPRRLAEKYGAIWTAEGSPLLKYSRRIADRLRDSLLARHASGLQVALAMRYGKPDIPGRLRTLEAEGVELLVVLPLYPQYSRTTTESVRDALVNWPRRIDVIEEYHDDAGYIAALAESVRSYWMVNGRGDHLLISFHGIPEQYVREGDPYAAQCHASAQRLAQALALDQTTWSVAFQSRLGRAPWVKPYTDQELPRLAQEGVRTLDVICPGFPADCLETLEEVGMRYADQFLRCGGTALRYIPALNDSPKHIEALAGLVSSKLDAEILR